MKKKSWIIVALLLLIVLIIGFVAFRRGNTAPGDGRPIIKIGMSLPLTGNLVYAGEGMKAAIAVFQEELATRNDLKNHYEFIVEDNGWNSKNIVSATNKLFGIDHVNALLDFGSIVGQISSPLAEKHKIVHFNACASDITIADGDYNFVITTTPEDEAKMLAGKVRGKYKNVAIIGQNEVASKVTTDALFSHFKADKIKYESYFVNQNETDFRTLIGKIKTQTPDLYIVILYSPGLEIFMKQFRESGAVSAPIFSTHFFANISDYKLIEGAHFADFAFMQLDLKQRVWDKTPGNSYEMCIGYVYDAASLLVDAFETSDNPKDVANVMSQMQNYKGVTETMAQDKVGVFRVAPVWKTIENGKIKTIKE